MTLPFFRGRGARRLMLGIGSRLFPVLLAFPVLCTVADARAESTAEPADTAGLGGHWEGMIEVPGSPLQVMVDFSQAESGWSGTIDIPMQGAKGLPLAGVVVQADSVRFEIAGVPGAPTFSGTVRGARIEGRFTQGGHSLPFHLGREKLAGPNRPQEPKPPFPYRSEEVSFKNGAITIAGTLTVPEGDGPFPAAVLASGSGAEDRDETLLGHKPFLVLADDLTRHGIAVLRTDDRGVGGSSGSTMNSTTEDFAGDALAGIAFLRARPEIDARHVGIIGHSEGAMIGAIAASRSKDVGFLVMMAGTGVPGRDVVLKQTEAIARAAGLPDEALRMVRDLLSRALGLASAGADSAAIRSALDEMAGPEIAAAPDSLHPILEGVRDQTVQLASTMEHPWFRFFLTYDPRTALRHVTIPVLVLNGEKDLQVIPDQNVPEIEKALKEAGDEQVTVKRLPGLNHLFQPAKTGAPTEYAGIETTIDPSALDAVASWIRKKAASR